MRKLYLDCGMGAAGDMLTAALLELFPDPEAVTAELNALGVPQVRYRLEKAEKCGIQGSRVRVFVGEVEEGETAAESLHHHSHSSMAQLERQIAQIQASDRVKENILAVYRTIARAESLVHGVEVTEIHFHEVGTLDALADITAVCFLMEKLGYPTVYASPVHVGSGHISCAHGILPVPAPATAEILKGVPIYGGQIRGELCTPTGAALLKQFVRQFGDMPVMVPEKIGYGMGKKDFAIANCVRVFLGQDECGRDEIVELTCNLDDMTGEDIGFAMEQLLDAGAPEVFTSPIGMKKNRPGVMLTVLCRPEQEAEMVKLIFRHTTTLGIRKAGRRRFTLDRHTEEVQTPYGIVRCKVAQGQGIRRCKPEYEDLSKIAREQSLSLSETRSAVKTE